MLHSIPCRTKQYQSDRGSFAKASGSYAIIVSQSKEDNKTKLKLPSGVKKTVSGSERAMLDILILIFKIMLLAKNN